MPTPNEVLERIEEEASNSYGQSPITHQEDDIDSPDYFTPTYDQEHQYHNVTYMGGYE